MTVPTEHLVTASEPPTILKALTCAIQELAGIMRKETVLPETQRRIDMILLRLHKAEEAEDERAVQEMIESHSG